MNDEDIIRIAKEAGLHIATDVNWMPIIGFECAKKFADLIRQDEREMCANLCDEIASEKWAIYKGKSLVIGHEKDKANPQVQGESDGADICAAAIRARGEL